MKTFIQKFLQKNNLLKEISIYGVGNIFTRLISYFLVPIHTKFLSPNSYGIICELYSYLAFLQVIYTLGLDSAYFKFARVKIYSHFAKTFSLLTSLFFSAIIFGGLYFSGFLNKITSFTSIKKSYILICLAILCIESMLNVSFLNLRYKKKLKKFSALKILQVTLNLFFNSLIFFSHANIFSITEELLVLFVFASNFFSSVIIFFIFNLYDERFKFFFSKKLFFRSIKIGLPFVYMSLVLICNDVLGKISLRLWLPQKFFIGPSMQHTIGVLSACQKIASVITLCTQAYRFALEPLFFRGNYLKENFYNRNLFWFTNLGCLAIVLISLNINIIAKIFLGRGEYAVALKIIPSILVSNFLSGIYYNLSFWTKTLNKLKIGTFISTFNFFSNIFLNFLLIPKVGYWGVSISSIISACLSCSIAFLLAKKNNIHFKIFHLMLFLPLTLFFSNYFINIDLENIAILKNVLYSIIVFVIYLIMSFKLFKISALK